MSETIRHEAFLLSMAKALHACGSPAPDLERIISDLGAKLGPGAQSFSLPTMFGIAINEPDGGQRVRLLRLPPSDYNMVRLIDLEKLAHEFTGPESIPTAEERLNKILSTSPPWLGVKLIFCGFILSASVAALFKGGYIEMLCGGLVGMLFVAAYLMLSRLSRLGPVLPVLLCALSAFVAKGLFVLLPGQTVFISILSGIVLILPGFTTTIALSELATMNLLSGSGRLAGAFILTVMMGAGVAIGTKIGDATFPNIVAGVTTPVPLWVFWVSVVTLGFSFLGVLQAPLSSAFVSSGACLLACGVSMIAGANMGGIAAAFLTAFAVSFAGHVYHKFTDKPAMLVQVPGLLTLVPGSVGFRGLNALIEQNFLEGIRITTDMILTATALAVGTLLANGIAPMLLNPRDQAIEKGRAPGIM
jgi:uncharacterized membrane protein YjjP (DUF1212 family)